jgi:hypothetical protein
MGLATLNVWVHDIVDPCRISDEPWFVAVTYCNGNPVEWCGHTYWLEEAKCGHAEFQLPPGCYIIYGFQFFLSKPLPLFRLTERAMVVVGCDQLACVHLYNPPYRQLPGNASMAVRYLAETGKLPREKVSNFVAACDALLTDMPQSSVDRAFDALLQQLSAAIQKNPPK